MSTGLQCLPAQIPVDITNKYTKPGKRAAAQETKNRCHPCVRNLKESWKNKVMKKGRMRWGTLGSPALWEVVQAVQGSRGCRWRTAHQSCLDGEHWTWRWAKHGPWNCRLPLVTEEPQRRVSSAALGSPGITWQVHQEENDLGAGACPWRGRWQLQEGGLVQAQCVLGTVARSNSKPDANSWLLVQWVHQMQGKNISGIKFPFWNYSGLKLSHLPYSSLDHERLHQPVLWCESQGEHSISSEVHSKGTLPVYGQTLSTVTDEKHQNLLPDLWKNS